ncbi:SOS response-associated peptidase family protein [Polaribacter vadi]|uniref:SOS response-associated peptidase family protein n=1 Tax=Polaribacter vadi TaxID=1774273 RepID=UPI0009F29875|nr:SOS response-associated peptidase family protein [Polaribacter vadi]
MNGFYEWQHRGKEKIKCEIDFNSQLSDFAGLYTNNTYTITTTEAMGVGSVILNTKLRMPFSLKTESDMQRWLNNEELAPQYNFTPT